MELGNALPPAWNDGNEKGTKRVVPIVPSPSFPKFIEALNDKEIQEIAFNRYGFRTGLSGGQYDVKAIGVDGLPQEILNVVPGLKMDTYNLIIEGLKEVEF